MRPDGAFNNWPTGRGFDYLYGLTGGETNQFYPALFRNIIPVDAPSRTDKGYRLTTDLADDCIAWIRTQKLSRLIVDSSCTLPHEGYTAPNQLRSNRGDATQVFLKRAWDWCCEVVLVRQHDMDW